MENTDSSTAGGTWGGVLAIVLTGLLLGTAYNALGLQPRAGWGLAWIAEDKVASMPSLGSLAPGGGGQPAPGPSTYGQADDPMAMVGGAAVNGLPEVPDLDRPIEVDTAVVRQFVDARAALVIDAREPDEFAEGHLPGAVNMPYDQVITDPARLEGLAPEGRPMIVYCGGGTCELSLTLAYELLALGHRRVLVYTGGFPEWSDRGHPVARGAGG